MKHSFQNYIKVFVAIVFIASLAYYTYFQAKDFLNGPVVEVFFPTDGLLVNESFIEIEGSAQNISHLTLNGRQIFTDNTGEFKEQLLLAHGYNIITIEAKDRFDRTTQETLELVYK